MDEKIDSCMSCSCVTVSLPNLKFNFNYTASRQVRLASVGPGSMFQSIIEPRWVKRAEKMFIIAYVRMEEFIISRKAYNFISESN